MSGAGIAAALYAIGAVRTLVGILKFNRAGRRIIAWPMGVFMVIGWWVMDLSYIAAELKGRQP